MKIGQTNYQNINNTSPTFGKVIPFQVLNEQGFEIKAFEVVKSVGNSFCRNFNSAKSNKPLKTKSAIKTRDLFRTIRERLCEHDSSAADDIQSFSYASDTQKSKRYLLTGSDIGTYRSIATDYNNRKISYASYLDAKRRLAQKSKDTFTASVKINDKNKISDLDILY